MRNGKAVDRFSAIAARVIEKFAKPLVVAIVCGSFPVTDVVQAQQSQTSLSDLQQILQDRQGQNTGQIDTNNASNSQNPLVLRPDNFRSSPLPASRLEQIMSSRANIKLTQFGYDQFGEGRNVTVPQAGAVQDGYIIGGGDELVVSLRGQESSEYRTTVNRSGQVVLPRLAPILAAGRTLGDFRQALENAVHNAYVSTQVFVSLGRIRQISVIVSGEVNNPGSRLVTGLSSPIDAILLSGGIKKTGSLRDIKLVRGGSRSTIDLYDILAQTGKARSILLTDGDTIVVPPLGRTVAVAGWVRRQGIYELSAAQSATTVRSLLSLAGGLEVRGRYNMSVLRLMPNGSDSLVSTSSESAVVRDSEILFVRLNAQQSVGQATLSGGTPLAGQYPIGKSARLSGLLQAPGALGVNPYTLFGAIVRRDAVTQLRTLIPFTPVAVVSGREDVEIRSDDLVRIFTANEARLLSAVIMEFQQRVDRAQNQDQLDVSQIENQNNLRDQQNLPPPAAAGQTNSSTAPNNNMNFNQKGSDERSIISSLVTKTLSEAGTLSDRPATNENSPYGLTRAQRSYLQQPSTGAQNGNQNLADQLLDGTDNGRSDYQSAADQDAGSTASAEKSDAEQLARQAYARQSGINHDETQFTPNMETQQVLPGQIPTNTEVQTFGQLARQLRVDPLVLIHFLMDHNATIDGSIRGGGLFLVGPNASANDMIAAAGGLNSWTDKSGFEVVTTSVDQDTGRANTEHQLLAANDNTLNSYLIKPHDELRFNATFTNVGIGTVTIKGQVRNAGTYHIERGERLSELLLRAGGLTDQAYPYGTIFLRKSAAATERDGYRRAAADINDGVAEGLTRTGSQHLDASAFQAIQSFITELRNTPAVGRIIATADPAVLAADPGRDTTLEPGDVVFIPQRPSTVAVLGQVMQPGNLTFNSKSSAADYIEQAGGYGQFADDSRVFLVLPDGSARRVESSWINLDSSTIPPGSTLVVPRDLAPFDLRQTILDAGQIFSSLAVAAASLSVISHN